jgi:hypothetical protein
MSLRSLLLKLRTSRCRSTFGDLIIRYFYISAIMQRDLLL